MARKSVATLTGFLEDSVYTSCFIEEVFQLLSVLIVSHGMTSSLDSAGIVASLIPMLQYKCSNTSQVRVCN